MIAKFLAILAVIIVGILFAHVILTKQPTRAPEYEDFGDYFFNQ